MVIYVASKIPMYSIVWLWLIVWVKRAQTTKVTKPKTLLLVNVLLFLTPPLNNNNNLFYFRHRSIMWVFTLNRNSSTHQSQTLINLSCCLIMYYIDSLLSMKKLTNRQNSTGIIPHCRIKTEWLTLSSSWSVLSPIVPAVHILLLSFLLPIYANSPRHLPPLLSSTCIIFPSLYLFGTAACQQHLEC